MVLVQIGELVLVLFYQSAELLLALADDALIGGPFGEWHDNFVITLNFWLGARGSDDDA